MTENCSQLKKVGLKITTPRLKILEIFEQYKGGHFSAEDIYKQLLNHNEDIGLATIYRVLAQFESAGLIIRHYFDTGHFVFEMNQEDHHDHLVCVRCGHVEEFLDEVIEQRQAIIAKKAKFNITAHTLNIYGVCAQCSAEDKPKREDT